MSEQSKIEIKEILIRTGSYLDRVRAAAEAKEFGMALRCSHKAEALLRIVEDYDLKMSGNFDIRVHTAHKEFFKPFSRWLSLWDKYVGEPIVHDKLLHFWRFKY